jgi:dTDP-4-amino-4,6-dideoxygalactose transaminase
MQEAFSIAGKGKGAFPVTELACEEVLSLPMHTELTEEQLVFITDAIKEFYSTR